MEGFSVLPNSYAKINHHDLLIILAPTLHHHETIQRQDTSQLDPSVNWARWLAGVRNRNEPNATNH